MLRIGVFGVGHLGKIHLKLIQQLNKRFELVGFFDPADDAANYAIEHFGVTRFTNQDALIDAVDCIAIVTPTVHHFSIATTAIRQSKHVFIEKPVTATIEEAKALMQLATEAGVQVQVGHVERFNPAFIAAAPYIHKPMFIETHRMATYNPRGTDVSVILDLMIHDIDILLSIVRSSIKRISANGVAVVSDTPDIASARIEFDNGCVANLTASRISQFNQRESRIFQLGAYIGIDFLDKKVEFVNEVKDTSGFETSHIAVIQSNAIEEELRDFYRSITTNTSPIVSIEDAHRSMALAYEIMEKLKLGNRLPVDNI